MPSPVPPYSPRQPKKGAPKQRPVKKYGGVGKRDPQAKGASEAQNRLLRDFGGNLLYSLGGGAGDGFRYGGGGGGGGGSSGYQNYLNQLQALRQQAISQTTQTRDQDLAALSGLRGAAIPAIDRYAGQYQGQVKTAFDQNAQQSQAYQAQLAQMANQIAGGLTAYANPIAGDLAAQGADASALQPTLGAAQAGASALAGAQGTYNTRLAQIMDAARLDYRNLGASTQQAGRSMAENEYMAGAGAIRQQYADALLNLQLMGLGG